MFKFLFLFTLIHPALAQDTMKKFSNPYLIILGNVQDAGSPQLGCTKNCCKNLFIHPDNKRKVASLGIVDPLNKKSFLIDATPDITAQLYLLQSCLENALSAPNAIFLTHAHIGHYIGLIYFGKEAMDSKEIPVYAMPRMKNFLENNGPWDQLIKRQNILLRVMQGNKSVHASSYITITPFLVPHRDEYSETVGYTIVGPNRKVLYIPDIDKWTHWDQNIVKKISEVDYALIDGTFFGENELSNRNMAEVPHPLITESMNFFKDLSTKEKNKIYFIHLNHTNPLLNQKSKEYQWVISSGYHVAEFGQLLSL